jgi:hypothetical protein
MKGKKVIKPKKEKKAVDVQSKRIYNERPKQGNRR